MSGCIAFPKSFDDHSGYIETAPPQTRQAPVWLKANKATATAGSQQLVVIFDKKQPRYKIYGPSVEFVDFIEAPIINKETSSIFLRALVVLSVILMIGGIPVVYAFSGDWAGIPFLIGLALWTVVGYVAKSNS